MGTELFLNRRAEKIGDLEKFTRRLIRGRKSDMKETNGGINDEQNRSNDRESKSSC